MKPITDRDIEVLARTVNGEGEGENDLGMLGIAFSIVNRAKIKDWSIAEACLKSIHYSAWNNNWRNDENQLRMLTRDRSNKAYARCVIAALKAAHGLVEDPTKGSTHYYRTGINEPDWAVGKPIQVVLHHHQFYKDIAF